MIAKFVELMYLKTSIPTHQRRPATARAYFNLIVANYTLAICVIGAHGIDSFKQLVHVHESVIEAFSAI